MLGVMFLCCVLNKMQSDSMPSAETPEEQAARVERERQAAAAAEGQPATGGRHRGVKAKTLRRMLKKAGLKVSGKKSTLTKRAKKAHLMRGGDASASAAPSTAAGYPFAPGMVGGGYGALPNAATHAGLVGGRRHGVKAKTLM